MIISFFLFFLQLATLNGPDIRKLIKASNRLTAVLTEAQVIAWDSIRAVIDGVLGKKREDGWQVLVQNMLDSLKNIGVSLTLKLHLLSHHLDQFEKQSPAESDEHGERIHQVMK